MTFERFVEHRDKAEEAQTQGAFESAANNFTLAAYEILGSSNCTTAPLEDDSTKVGRGLCSLLSSAVCYRRAGVEDRCRNRCHQGILVCEDIEDHVAAYAPQKGLMNEYIGDYRLIGDLGNHEAAYENARTIYEETDNHIGWQAEPEFELNMTFFLELAKSADVDIDRTTKASIKAESLVDRIEFKRDRFPAILETVVTDS